MWWIRRECVRWGRGASRPTSWAPASRNSVSCSISAASTTADTNLSPGAPCVRRWMRGVLIPTVCCRTSGFSRRSVFLPGPPVRVANPDLRHHRVERPIEIDSLCVGEADHHEQDVAQLECKVSVSLARFLLLLSETMVHLARQLPHLFGEPGEDRERREVAFLILSNPLVDCRLSFAKRHGSLRR